MSLGVFNYIILMITNIFIGTSVRPRGSVIDTLFYQEYIGGYTMYTRISILKFTLIPIEKLVMRYVYAE